MKVNVMKKKVIGYFSNWITLEEVKSKSEGYTDLLFSFWQDPETGVKGAAEAVMKNPDILRFLKSKNKKCILAAGGEYLDPLDYDAISYGTALAKYAIEHQFEGVDLDIERISMNPQTIQWLIDATLAVRQISNEFNYPLQISHAPQAPFFSSDGGYSDVERGTNGIIEYYNIQYYNQGGWEYQSYKNYESLFDEQYNNIENPSCIPSIIKQGISGDKLIIGKPITQSDVNNTGYIPLETLENILKKAITNEIRFGGIMGWKVDSDVNGEWGKDMAELLLHEKQEFKL